MANSNGRIYIDTDANPHVGISIGDLQDVLGTSKNDIGQIVRDADINKWAKYKPVRLSKLGVLTDSDRLLAIWGMDMAQFGRLDYVDNYDTEWGYNRPRGMGGGSQGYDEWFRFLDFDGYQHNKWQEVASGGMLIGIFNAQMTTPGASVAALDSISFELQCRENDDADPYLGLLYPYDFDGADSPYDIADYYLGIAIVDNINSTGQNVTRHLRVISGPQISDYFQTQGYHLYAVMQAQIPSTGLDYSDIIIAPVLLSHNTIPAGQTDPEWSTYEYTGATIVTLNGAYLPAHLFADNNNVKVTTDNVVIGASSITFDVTVQNLTGDQVRILELIGYVLSDEAEANEHANGYTGNPDYYGMGAGPYVQSEWPTYKQGDIVTHDWTGQAETIDELGARYVNLKSLFVAENGSEYLGNGRSVTFQVTIPQAVKQGNVGDDFGPYSTGAWLYVGLHVGNFNIMRTQRLIEPQ